jgi:type 1 glutamine amidotransferase
MSLSIPTSIRHAIMLLISVMLMSGCSSSSDPQNVMTDDGVVPDPLVQNSTVIGFDITVPTYGSDSLQVRLVWGDREIMAQWVGDEFWSVSGDFPTNTENLLVVTFYDGNGDITLGSFEQDFRTGTSDLEVYIITADQFNTDQWDNDRDGVSNINDSFPGTDAPDSARVLLFSETRDFRHSSIEIALGALEELAASTSIQTDRADDSLGVFTDANLANYDAVVWVMTSGDVLNADEQAAFERYIRSGRGYVGIHAASFTEYEWPWYGALVGAYFDSHPVVQSAIQVIEDSSHPSTAHLRSTWTRVDEWYDYRTNPRAQVNVLLSLDEGSYSGGTMGDDHPSAWYHDYDGGRSWYTGGGHTNDSYSEPNFRTHLLGGLRYAAGLSE